MEQKRFIVTEEHLKLLPHLWFNYDDWTEFGAPAVDPKRPYGNSDVYNDLAEHLGIERELDEWDEERELTDEEQDRLLKLHQEMTSVLNIMVRNNGVRVGEYVADRYNVDWKPADE